MNFGIPLCRALRIVAIRLMKTTPANALFSDTQQSYKIAQRFMFDKQPDGMAVIISSVCANLRAHHISSKL